MQAHKQNYTACSVGNNYVVKHSYVGLAHVENSSTVFMNAKNP